jgi:hypothetical protein
MRTLPALLVAASLVACGDPAVEAPLDAGVLPDAEVAPDADPDAFDVTLHARGAALLAIREGDRPWRALTPGADGDVTVAVAPGRYAIARVCDTADDFDLSVLLAGPADPRAHDLACEPGPARVTVSIDLAEAFVSVGSRRIGLPTELDAGTYDVIALERGVEVPRFVIRRGVVLDEDTALRFDFDAEGTPMRAMALTTDALGDGESLSYSGVELSTAGGGRYYELSVDPARTLVFPASALGAGDTQLAELTAGRDSWLVVRAGARAITGDPESAAITLAPEGTASATLDGALSVTWQAEGTWPQALAYAYDDLQTQRQGVEALPGWYAAGGATGGLTMPQAAELPGWDPAWRLLEPGPYVRWHVSLDRAGADGRESLYFDAAFGEEASARHAHGDAEEVRAARVLRHQRLGVR